MATYKDVALVNNSLDQLADSLLKQRVMDQQEQDKQAERSQRGQQLGIEQQRVDAANKLADQKQKDAQAKELQRRREVALRLWDGNTKTFASMVKDGTMPADQANAALQHAYAAVPPDQQAAIADHPTVQAIQSGQPIFKAPDKGAGFNTAPIANKRAWEADIAKAKALRDQADQQEKAELEVNPTAAAQRDVMHQKADEIERNANEFFRPKQPVADEDKPSVSVTTKPDGETGPVVTQKLSPNAYQQQQGQALAQKKAKRANDLAAQHPKMSRDQILQQVQKEFSGK